MSGTMSKDLAKLAKALRAEGWTVELTRKGHVRWTAPSGEATVTGAHPAPPTMRRVRGQIARLQRNMEK